MSIAVAKTEAIGMRNCRHPRAPKDTIRTGLTPMTAVIGRDGVGKNRPSDALVS